MYELYDKGKIIPGLIIFVALITFPIWFRVASGSVSRKPQPVLPTGEEKCVEPRQYMRDKHMELLDTWRDAVVREGKRIYVATDGTKCEMSLSNTCMKCHSNKAQFCEQCHNYAGLTPHCWDCHVEPKGD